MKPKDAKDRLLSPHEAGQLSTPPLTSETMRTLDDTGKLPAMKTPTGRRLWWESDVRTYFAQRGPR